ncbi:MAG: hypothetical protein U0792_05420 [Gemmataceae bacterium]
MNLPTAVYQAFGLVPLTDVPPEPEPAKPRERTKEPEKQEKQEKRDEPARDPREEEIEAREEAVGKWATTRKITQRDANTIRGDLLDMIGAAIDWDAELRSVPRDLTAPAGRGARPAAEESDGDDADDGETGPPAGAKYRRASLRTAVGPQWVYLPFSRTEVGATPDDALFTLCRDEVFDDPARFAEVRFELRALLRFHTYKTFDYPGGDEDRGWYARLCERATRQAVEFLRSRYERVPDDASATTAVAQALYVSARVLNLEGAHSNRDADVLKAVLTAAPVTVVKGDRWQNFRHDCATHRATARDFLLRRVAAYQGAGAVAYGVDTARLLAALEPARKACRVLAEFPGERDRLDANARQVRDFVAALGTGATDAAVSARRADLMKWVADTRAWLGPDFNKDAFVDDCLGLMNQASNLKVFRADVEYETLRKYANAFRDAAVTEAISAVDRLTDEAAPGVVMTALVQAPDDAMQTATTFRMAFQAFVKQTLPAAQAALRQTLKLAGADIHADPDTLLPAEAAKLDADLVAIAAAAGVGAAPAAATPAAGVPAPAEVRPPAPLGRFTELRAVLDRLSRVDTVAQQLQELEPIRKAVNGWAVELPVLIDQHKLFVGRPDVAVEDAPDGTKVVNAVAVARTKVAESPLEITHGRTFANLEAAATKLVTGYRDAINAAWAVWVEKFAPRVDDAELAPFETHPEYRQAVSDIKANRKELNRLKKDPATDRAGFDLVEQLSVTLRQLLGKLPTQAPDEVKKFLAATNTREGATLDMLTTPVLDWLRANNQLDKYRIWR